MNIKSIINNLYCHHDWQVIDKTIIKLFEHQDDQIPVSTRYIEIQKCSKCSKIRKQKIKY